LVVLLYTCEGERRYPLVDLLNMLPSDYAFVTIIRYPWVDVEWRWTLVDLRSPLGSTFGVLRSTFRWCRRSTASEGSCFRLIWLRWTEGYVRWTSTRVFLRWTLR
jgi:hypothetical protein